MKRQLSIAFAAASMMVLASTMAFAFPPPNGLPPPPPTDCTIRMNCGSTIRSGPNTVTAQLSGNATSFVSAPDPVTFVRTSSWSSFLLTGNVPTLGFVRITLNPATPSAGTITIPASSEKYYPATATNKFFWRIEAAGMTLVSSDTAQQVATVFSVPPLAGTQFVLSDSVRFYQASDPLHTTVLTLKSATATITPPGQTFSDNDFIMNASQEVPTNGSTKTGFGVFELDTLNNKLHFDITHNVSNETAAHIHGPSERGVNAGVLFGLPAGAHKVGTWNYPQSSEADLLAGRMYANIHSTAFPGGEIRGQIEPHTAQSLVPSLSEWGSLLLAGLLLILSVVYLRRRRLGADGAR